MADMFPPKPSDPDTGNKKSLSSRVKDCQKLVNHATTRFKEQVEEDKRTLAALEREVGDFRKDVDRTTAAVNRAMKAQPTIVKVVVTNAGKVDVGISLNGGPRDDKTSATSDHKKDKDFRSSDQNETSRDTADTKHYQDRDLPSKNDEGSGKNAAERVEDDYEQAPEVDKGEPKHQKPGTKNDKQKSKQKQKKKSKTDKRATKFDLKRQLTSNPEQWPGLPKPESNCQGHEPKKAQEQETESKQEEVPSSKPPKEETKQEEDSTQDEDAMNTPGTTDNDQDQRSSPKDQESATGEAEANAANSDSSSVTLIADNQGKGDETTSSAETSCPNHANCTADHEIEVYKAVDQVFKFAQMCFDRHWKPEQDMGPEADQHQALAAALKRGCVTLTKLYSQAVLNPIHMAYGVLDLSGW